MNLDLNIPTGGFPPIYVCQSTNNVKNERKREYKTHNTSVSIKTLLEKRKTVIPFMKINNK